MVDYENLSETADQDHRRKTGSGSMMTSQTNHIARRNWGVLAAACAMVTHRLE